MNQKFNIIIFHLLVATRIRLEEWKTSDTLVEFEPIDSQKKNLTELNSIALSCSKHDSIEKCRNATTSSVKCIWSEKANMCINSDDNDVK
ncbi:unnamed protein product, partial [Schistosoma bovis]